jgi:hypothetical protein
MTHTRPKTINDPMTPNDDYDPMTINDAQ